MAKMRILLILLALLLLMGCGGLVEYEQEEQAYEEQEEPAYEVEEEEEEPAYEEQEEQEQPKEEPAPTSPSYSVRVFVNGVGYQLDAYVVYDRLYFLLDDIAVILGNTQARFNFNRDFGLFVIHRGDVYAPSEYTLTTDILGFSRIGIHIPATLRTEFHELTFEIYSTAQGLHFALEDLADFLGFTIDLEHYSNDIFINTHDTIISEYGRAVLEEFLRNRPTFFVDMSYWTDELMQASQSISFAEVYRPWDEAWGLPYLYPLDFFLYDINNSGIPDIIVLYDVPPGAMFRQFILYTYENGEYVRNGILPEWYLFYRNQKDEIFLWEGNHHNGWERMCQIILKDAQIFREAIVESWVGVQSHSERWREIMSVRAYVNPLRPVWPLDPPQPLTFIPRLSSLKIELTLALTQEL